MKSETKIELINESDDIEKDEKVIPVKRPVFVYQEECDYDDDSTAPETDIAYGSRVRDNVTKYSYLGLNIG